MFKTSLFSPGGVEGQHQMSKFLKFQSVRQKQTHIQNSSHNKREAVGYLYRFSTGLVMFGLSVEEEG